MGNSNNHKYNVFNMLNQNNNEDQDKDQNDACFSILKNYQKNLKNVSSSKETADNTQPENNHSSSALVKSNPPTQQKDNATMKASLKQKITPEDKSYQVAVNFLNRLGWTINDSSVSILMAVFASKKYGATNKSLLDYAKGGARIEEIKLSYEIRQRWMESDHLWNKSYSKSNANINWRLCLDLINDFTKRHDKYPDIDEIWAFIEDSYQCWYQKIYSRLSSYSFSEYLRKIINKCADSFVSAREMLNFDSYSPEEGEFDDDYSNDGSNDFLIKEILLQINGVSHKHYNYF